MKIYSNNIKDGFLEDAFGYRGSQFYKTMPNRSFHLAWQDLPAGTKTLALTFIDHDAIPVCGFTVIHWCVANIDPKLNELPENASVELDLLQGVNSRVSNLLPDSRRLSKEEASYYNGCSPPDKTHKYLINLYALDTSLALKPGFYYNELLDAMAGHVLDGAALQFYYKTKGAV